MLTESGIYPERLAAEEDIKKLERKYSEIDINKITDSKILDMNTLEIDITGVSSKIESERISKLIKNNQGSSVIKMYYGSKENIKTITREIQINSEVITGLRKYLVITDHNLP